MRVLSVTHGPTVRSELWGDVVREDGHELVEWDLPVQGTPTVDADAVIVLGGHQNVGEEVRHPWLRDEYELLRRWVDEGTPLFGICLGGQTLAHATGGAVGPASSLLAGFYETELTDEGAADPVLGVLPRRFEALNANGYTFAVPAEAVVLARGPVTQAFRIGERAWGVQFHPEARRDQVAGWWSAALEEGSALPAPLERLEGDLEQKLPAWQELGRRLCRAFLAAAR
jgi:GMP synthase-like glutamine amidotransferase